MSQAGSEREGGISAQDELTRVVAELRAELQSIREREMRRDDLARTLGRQLQQVESQLAQLAARTSALDDVQRNLGRTRDAVAGLTTRADRAEQTSQRLAEEQALALAQVKVATDALAGTVGAVRAAIGAVIETGRDATVDAVDERVGARLDDSSARVQSAITARLDEALTDLGITQLRRSIAEVADQVVGGRGDARAIRESIAAFDDRVAQTTGTALLPVITALGRVRQQIDAIPAPDLGPVAAQLARLSAAVTALARDDTARAADLEALQTSVAEPLSAISEQLGAAAEATAVLAEGLADSLRAAFTEHLAAKLTEADAARQAGMEQLARQLTEADAVRQAGIDELSRQLEQQLRRADEQRTAFTEQVTHQLSQADVARHAGIERILTEVAAAREAAERRSGSRWRRSPGDEQPGAPARPTPAEQEQRIDQALRDLDHRLTSLAQLVERAGAFADDAAQASIATFRAVTAPPPPAPAPDEDGALDKTSTTKKTAAATRTTKTATKRVPAKKGTRRDEPGEPPHS